MAQREQSGKGSEAKISSKAEKVTQTREETEAENEPEKGEETETMLWLEIQESFVRTDWWGIGGFRLLGSDPTRTPGTKIP